MRFTTCAECGHDMQVDENGVSNHLDEFREEIDHDMDAIHVAIDEEHYSDDDNDGFTDVEADAMLLGEREGWDEWMEDAYLESLYEREDD